MSRRSKRVRYVSPLAIFFLATWYLGLILIGGCSTYFFYATANSSTPTFESTIPICASIALAASSVFYLRKLYRDVFAVSESNTPNASPVENMAVLIYYFSRPLFAVFFSFASLVATYTLVRTSVDGQLVLSEGFLLVNVLVSIFAGVATGAAVERLEGVGKTRVESANI